MAERGYYSLIQYVPDHGRAEGANVGIALVCPSKGEAAVVMSDNNEGPKRRFSAATFDDHRLTIAKRALAGRLRHELEAAPALETLARSRNLEGNALILSEPRTVAVDGPTLSVAESLCKELVYLHERRRNRVRLPEFGWIVPFLEERNVPIQKPGEIIVPVIEEPIKVAFSYVNGAQHFVHARGFPADRHEALKHARDVGAQGRFLHHHSDARLRRKLTVLGRVPDADLEAQLTKVLSELHVRLVPEGRFQEFADEVRVNAHEPPPGLLIEH